MLKPSFRFFIVPLGAVATLATMSTQNVQPDPDALSSVSASIVLVHDRSLMPMPARAIGQPRASSGATVPGGQSILEMS